MGWAARQKKDKKNPSNVIDTKYSSFAQRVGNKKCSFTVAPDENTGHLYLDIHMKSNPKIRYKKEILFGVDGQNDFMSYLEFSMKYLRMEDKLIGQFQNKIVDLIGKDKGLIDDIDNGMPIHVGTLEFANYFKFYSHSTR